MCWICHAVADLWKTRIFVVDVIVSVGFDLNEICRSILCVGRVSVFSTPTKKVPLSRLDTSCDLTHQLALVILFGHSEEKSESIICFSFRGPSQQQQQHDYHGRVFSHC